MNTHMNRTMFLQENLGTLTNHHKVPTLHSPPRLVLLFIPAARNNPLPKADFRTTIRIRQRKLRALEICVILERA